MDASQFIAPGWGRVISTLGPASYQAFIPAKVPRELTLSAEIIMKLSDADAALGRLAGSGRLLPNPHLLTTSVRWSTGCTAFSTMTSRSRFA